MFSSFVLGRIRIAARPRLFAARTLDGRHRRESSLALSFEATAGSVPSANQNHRQIVHIGLCQTSNDRVTEHFQGRLGFMSDEHFPEAYALVACARLCRPVDEPARDVRPTVGAVGVDE